MKPMSKALLGAALGAGVFALTSATASAAIVCTGPVCWHVHEAYTYPSEAGVVVHPDTWRWGPSERFSWREHEGRGYWHGDRWMEW